MFEDAILKIEGDEICGNEAVRIINDLQKKLQNQIDLTYVSIEAEDALRELNQTDPRFADTDQILQDTVLSLYRKLFLAENFCL